MRYVVFVFLGLLFGSVAGCNLIYNNLTEAKKNSFLCVFHLPPPEDCK